VTFEQKITAMFYSRTPPRTHPLSRDEIAEVSARFFRSLPKSLHTRELALATIANDIGVTLDELDLSVWSIDVLRAFARKYGQTTMSALFHKSAESVKMTPKQRRQLCHIAVHQSPFAIRDIPELYRHDVELCRLATRTGHNLRLVPIDLRTLEMCELALTKCAFTISEFPLEILTAKHCRTAVQMDPTAFPSVPPSFRTPEFARFAVQHAKTLEDVMFYIVPHIVQVDDTLVRELVQTFGCEVLARIAQELISPTEWVDLVNVALASRTFRNEQVLQEILERPHFTEERYDVFCRMAVKSRPDALHHMTDLDLIWEMYTALRGVFQTKSLQTKSLQTVCKVKKTQQTSSRLVIGRCRQCSGICMHTSREPLAAQQKPLEPLEPLKTLRQKTPKQPKITPKQKTQKMPKQ
jgi:hypothetical protein